MTFQFLFMEFAINIMAGLVTKYVKKPAKYTKMALYSHSFHSRRHLCAYILLVARETSAVIKVSAWVDTSINISYVRNLYTLATLLNITFY